MAADTLTDIELFLADESETLKLGQTLGAVLTHPSIVFLEGDLGAGKTTLCRGILRGLGHQGSVKSPTYTIVEPYELPGGAIYHFDLYRLGDPEELEYLGLRDYVAQRAVIIVEWPERGGAWLPEPDLVVSLVPSQQGREIALNAKSPAGRALVAAARL